MDGKVNITNQQVKYIPNLVLDEKMLDLMCKMIVTDSQHIKRSHLMNMQRLLMSVDPKTYTSDTQHKLVSFLRKGLEARLEYNLNDPYLIIRHINGGMLNNDVIDDDFIGLDLARIAWLNNNISETLKYDYVYDHVDKMMDVCTRFKAQTFDSKSDIVKEFEECVIEAQNEFRRSRNESHTESTFSLTSEDFKDSVTDAYNQLANPRRKLRTGMQGMNELLGGGFESGRVYVYFGLPGEGKSTTLLNLMYQLKKYNKDYKPKDPTKIPTIVLLTMENTIVESIERLFGLSCVGSGDITDYSLDEVMNKLRNEGELRLDSSDPINILIKYIPTNSVDTSYLYTICDDLEDRGMEVMAMFQDYIGRIRSTQYLSDSRLEYGAVTDEFKVFAEFKDIPVITASQLNRDASRHIDEGRKKNKADLVRFIGRSNISESMLVLNNIDAGFVIAPEVTENNERYLGIQRIKIRYRASDREYIYLPYVGNTIKFMEDFGREATYKTTMRSENDLFSGNGVPFKQSPYHTNKIINLDDDNANADDATDEDLFESANCVSSARNAAYFRNDLKEKYSQLREPIVFFNPIPVMEAALREPIVFFNSVTAPETTLREPIKFFEPIKVDKTKEYCPIVFR